VPGFCFAVIAAAGCGAASFAACFAACRWQVSPFGRSQAFFRLFFKKKLARFVLK